MVIYLINRHEKPTETLANSEVIHICRLIVWSTFNESRESYFRLQFTTRL